MYHNGIYLEHFTGFSSSAGNNMTPTYFGKIAILGLGLWCLMPLSTIF